MKLWRGLRAGEDMSDNSSMIRLLLGWFFGSSLSLCSREYFNKSSFWLDSLNLAWAWISQNCSRGLNDSYMDAQVNLTLYMVSWKQWQWKNSSPIMLFQTCLIFLAWNIKGEFSCSCFLHIILVHLVVKSDLTLINISGSKRSESDPKSKQQMELKYLMACSSAIKKVFIPKSQMATKQETVVYIVSF